jgi:hypothetical protein
LGLLPSSAYSYNTILSGTLNSSHGLPWAGPREPRIHLKKSEIPPDALPVSEVTIMMATRTTMRPMTRTSIILIETSMIIFARG